MILRTLLSLLIVIASAQAAAPAPGDRPNMIYIFADQLRYESLGYAGDAKAQTPHIDRLAAQGVSFRNMVSNTPVCAPYRASLFTGQYSSSTENPKGDIIRTQKGTSFVSLGSTSRPTYFISILGPSSTISDVPTRRAFYMNAWFKPPF